MSLQLLSLGSILHPRLFLGHTAKYFSCSTGVFYWWARYCPSWADTSILQPRTLTYLLCLYHKGGIGMDELIVGLGRFKAANCRFLGSISNMSTHLLLFRNLSRLFPELTTECSYKSVGTGLLLLILTLLFTKWLLTEQCRCSHGTCIQAALWLQSHNENEKCFASFLLLFFWEETIPISNQDAQGFTHQKV